MVDLKLFMTFGQCPEANEGNIFLYPAKYNTDEFMNISVNTCLSNFYTWPKRKPAKLQESARISVEALE